jgi:hypothetical protein
MIKINWVAGSTACNVELSRSSSAHYIFDLTGKSTGIMDANLKIRRVPNNGFLLRFGSPIGK